VLLDQTHLPEQSQRAIDRRQADIRVANLDLRIWCLSVQVSISLPQHAQGQPSLRGQPPACLPQRVAQGITRLAHLRSPYCYCLSLAIIGPSATPVKRSQESNS
jgi:hypothetical protein